MAFSSKDRSKASYIRRLIRDGKTVSDEQARWLESYDAQRTWVAGESRKRDAQKAKKKATEKAPKTKPEEQPAKASAPTEPTAPPTDEQSTSTGAPPSEYQPIAKWSPPRPEPKTEPKADAPPVDATPHTSCPVKDCPECKRTAGAQQCGTTGRNVWPPMDDDEAQVWAAGVHMPMALGGRFVRGWFDKSREVIPPREADKAMMEKAIKKVTYRRANFVGAVGDLVLLAGAFGFYGAHIMMAPGTAEEGDDETPDNTTTTPADKPVKEKPPKPAPAAPEDAPGGPDDTQTRFDSAQLFVL